MEIYRVEDDSMRRINEHGLEKERQLEDRLTRPGGIQLGNVDMLLIDQQGGFQDDTRDSLDILGIDDKGNTVIVELKRDKGRRKVIAQGLDYASRIRNDEYEMLNERYNEFAERVEEGRQLSEAHADHFELEEPLSPSEFNSEQRIILVGTDFDDRLVDSADFLRTHNIDVILVEYETYKDEETGTELLTTNAIRRAIEEEPSASENLSQKQQRRKDFWEAFKNSYQKEGFQGSTPKKGASHSVYVFTSGKTKRPAYIRPTLNLLKGPYVVARFYDQTFAEGADNQSAFKRSIEEAEAELDVTLPDEFQNELEWDIDNTRNYDKVTVHNDSITYDGLTDQASLDETRRWFLDVTKVFDHALRKMDEEDRISH